MKHGNGKMSRFPVPKRETDSKRDRNGQNRVPGEWVGGNASETSGSKCGNVFYDYFGNVGSKERWRREKKRERERED